MAEILLVDDDGNVLLTLAIALRRRGHKVTLATSGEKALEQLKAQHFQFLVSDVRMPGMSGFDLARQARHLPQPPRVILTSAYSGISPTPGVADAFLQKPLDLARLDEMLHDNASSHNGGSQQRKENTNDNVPPQWQPAFSNGH